MYGLPQSHQDEASQATERSLTPRPKPFLFLPKKYELFLPVFLLRSLAGLSVSVSCHRWA